jgi:hypothetical protein
MSNNLKYKVTDIAHPEYPFLHRIQALQDIGCTVRAGDLGGYVQSESNLSTDPDDTAWVYADAIACNDALVTEHAVLQDQAIACDRALVTQGSALKGHSRIEDDACVLGSGMEDHARLSGFGIATSSSQTQKYPVLSGNCTVYGIVAGEVQVTGSTMIHSEEKIYNHSRDTWIFRDGLRMVERSPDRDKLQPKQQTTNEKHHNRKKDAYAR